MFKPYGRKKRLKNFLVLSFVCAILIYCATLFVNSQYNRNHTALKLGNSRVYKHEVEKKYFKMVRSNNVKLPVPYNKIPDNFVKSISNEIIIEKEIVKKAKKLNFHRKADVREKIEDSSRDILIKSYINSILNDAATDVKINSSYKDILLSIKGKKEYLVDMIQFSNKERAEKAYNSLMKTSDVYKSKNFKYFKRIYGSSVTRNYSAKFLIEDKVNDVAKKDYQSGKNVTMSGSDNSYKIFYIIEARNALIPELNSKLKNEIVKKLRYNAAREIIKSLAIDSNISTESFLKSISLKNE